MIKVPFIKFTLMKKRFLAVSSRYNSTKKDRFYYQNLVCSTWKKNVYLLHEPPYPGLPQTAHIHSFVHSFATDTHSKWHSHTAKRHMLLLSFWISNPLPYGSPLPFGRQSRNIQQYQQSPTPTTFSCSNSVRMTKLLNRKEKKKWNIIVSFSSEGARAIVLEAHRSHRSAFNVGEPQQIFPFRVIIG